MTVLASQRKVFGLGLSKTGTSSLNGALNRLGIRSLHFPHDAETHEQLRNADYRLRILERYQALTDISVAPYFAQLDQVWPGSKFVLTVRDQESWLRSAQMHWRVLLDTWDRDPQFRRFSEFILAATYGTIGFNAERLVYAYAAHVRNVLHYFAQSPDDLLIMNICAGDGWKPLCDFLDTPVPEAPFPHAFDWMSRLSHALQDIANLIPRGGTFLLVDHGKFGSVFADDRRCVPFPEREGIYSGPPADDAHAIGELERLRSTGASHIVFTWPVFWWLDFYRGLDRHLRSNFRCLLRDDRLVIFDLRAAPDAAA
jgi:hypothetical protein